MKSVCRIERDRIRFYTLKRGPRQMVTITSRLYRTDDRLMIKDSKTDSCMAVYRIDSTQPMYPESIYVDPDMTCVYIDSAKLSGTKKSIWGQLGNINKISNLLITLMVVGIVAYSILKGMIS